MHVCDKKDKIIERHKKNDYWKSMRLVDESNKRLYTVAKWVKNSVTTTNTKATIFQLSNKNVVVTTTKKKTKLLFKNHFSSSFTMILNDIINFDYVNLILDDESLTSKEMRRVIKKTISNKTSNLNDISNKMICSAMKIINEQIRSLFERYLRDEMQSTHFKRIATILLRKLNNKDYTNFKSYRSIALLNTLSKTLKSRRENEKSASESQNSRWLEASLEASDLISAMSRAGLEDYNLSIYRLLRFLLLSKLSKKKYIKN